MKRLLLSVLGGFCIPALYTIIVGLLAYYFQNPRISNYLWSPVQWPMKFFIHLFPALAPRSLQVEPFTYFLIATLCNVTLYGPLTYLILWLLSRRKPKTYPAPPPPNL